MLGTLGTALAGAAVTAGANYGLNKLFGPKQGAAQAPLANFTAPGFSAGGLTATADRTGNYSVSASPERLGLVNDIAGQFGAQAGELGGLRNRVAPGVSDLRAARLAEIDNARTAAIGNLRENLQRRRVLGSSFGQDTLARAENEFGQAKAKASAESFLQELELTNNLINQQYEASRNQFQTGLNEMNLQADVAAKLAAGSTATMGANARFLSALNAQEAAGAGKFMGDTFSPVTKAFGNYAGSFFGGGGATGGGSFAGNPWSAGSALPIAGVNF